MTKWLKSDGGLCLLNIMRAVSDAEQLNFARYVHHANTHISYYTIMLRDGSVNVQNIHLSPIYLS